MAPFLNKMIEIVNNMKLQIRSNHIIFMLNYSPFCNNLFRWTKSYDLDNLPSAVTKLMSNFTSSTWSCLGNLRPYILIYLLSLDIHVTTPGLNSLNAIALPRLDLISENQLVDSWSISPLIKKNISRMSKEN